MGRSGGGFSGGGSGGFSGGFSGGGRSIGGFGGGSSRGGRSSAPSSGYRGGFRGGFGLPFGMPFIINSPRYETNYNGGSPSDPNSGNSRPPQQGGSGCGCIVTAIAVIFIAAIITIILSTGIGGCSSDEVRSSTVERTPLAAGNVIETEYYTDASYDWIRDSAAMEAGLRRFYEETGVQPYVYILPNGTTQSSSQLSVYADELYDQLFDDEGHFLLVFCDTGYGNWNAGYAVGSQAKTILDDEALGILRDYLDRYYNDYSISEEEIFSNAFAATGERIMTVTPDPTVPIMIIVAVVIIVIIIALIIRSRMAQREREKQRMQDILNTPMEKFGDKDVEDLAAHYEKSREDLDDTAHPIKAAVKDAIQGDSSHEDLVSEKFGDKDLEDLADKYDDK